METLHNYLTGCVENGTLILNEQGFLKSLAVVTPDPHLGVEGIVSVFGSKGVDLAFWLRTSRTSENENSREYELFFFLDTKPTKLLTFFKEQTKAQVIDIIQLASGLDIVPIFTPASDRTASLPGQTS
jgi:hypothetical protein